MIKIANVTSIDQLELAPYRTLRQPAEHFRHGFFIAEGEKVVDRLIESGLEIISALLTPEWLEKKMESFALRPENIIVYVGEKTLVETIVGYNLHQGIMALGKVPVPADLDSVLRTASPPKLLVAVDGLTNSENLGVLVRNCAAFGVNAILAGETSSSPYLRRAVRNSMGTVFKIPVVHCSSIAESLVTLKMKYKFRIFAAHPHANEAGITNADFSGDCCFVFGSEGEGLSDKVLAICDRAVAIPMQSGVDSLNVACANAIFLYEAVRQRKRQQ